MRAAAPAPVPLVNAQETCRPGFGLPGHELINRNGRDGTEAIYPFSKLNHAKDPDDQSGRLQGDLRVLIAALPEATMRVNNAQSIKTANTVHTRFGTWQAAKESASLRDGKYVVRSAANGQFATVKRGDEDASKKK